MATDFAGAGMREFSVGRVFSRAFSTMSANPAAIFGIAFLLGALPQALVGLALGGLRAQLLQTGGFGGTIFLSLASAAVALVFLSAVQGGIIRATLAQNEGHEAAIGDCIVTGLRASLPMLVLLIVFSIAAMIGLCLFFVPGLFLLVIWSVSAPALVADRVGVFGAFGRSAELTKGARWQVLGCGVLFFVLYYIAFAVVGAIILSVFGLQNTVAASLHPSVFVTVLNVALSTLLAAYWATTQSSLYIELRDWKEGPQSARLSEIFA